MLPLHFIFHSWKKPYLYPVCVFPSSGVFFFLNRMNKFILMPCCEWPLSAAQCNLPRLAVLVVIATWHGRDQIWPISGPWFAWNLSRGASKKSGRYILHLFHQVSPQMLRPDLHREGGPMHIARNSSVSQTKVILGRGIWRCQWGFPTRHTTRSHIGNRRRQEITFENITYSRFQVCNQ